MGLTWWDFASWEVRRDSKKACPASPLGYPTAVSSWTGPKLNSRSFPQTCPCHGVGKWQICPFRPDTLKLLSAPLLFLHPMPSWWLRWLYLHTEWRFTCVPPPLLTPVVLPWLLPTACSDSRAGVTLQKTQGTSLLYSEAPNGSHLTLSKSQSLESPLGLPPNCPHPFSCLIAYSFLTMSVPFPSKTGPHLLGPFPLWSLLLVRSSPETLAGLTCSPPWHLS